MKILALTIALVLFSSVSAYSQALAFGIGADVAFPLNQLKDEVSTGYGATGLVKFGLIPLVDLTGGVEYLSFTGKSVTMNNQTGDATATTIGVLLGGRFNILPGAYGGLEFGTYSFTKKFPGSDESITRGIYVPMVGVSLSKFDLSARYIGAGDDSFWGFRGMIWF